MSTALRAWVVPDFGVGRWMPAFYVAAQADEVQKGGGRLVLELAADERRGGFCVCILVGMALRARAGWAWAGFGGAEMMKA